MTVEEEPHSGSQSLRELSDGGKGNFRPGSRTVDHELGRGHQVIPAMGGGSSLGPCVPRLPTCDFPVFLMLKCFSACKANALCGGKGRSSGEPV